MTGILRFVLSLFVGGAVGLVLLLISESITILLSCGVVALFFSAFVYKRVPIKKELKGLLAVAAAIVAFFVYFMLLNALNESNGSTLIGLIYFFGPFVAFTYSYTTPTNKADSNEKNDK